MNKNCLKSAISIMLTASILLGIVPATVFAQSQLCNENVNTNFAQNFSVNQWEEIERNTEIVLRDPGLYEKIEGLDLKGAQVSHDKNSRTYLLEDETYLTRYFEDPITYTDQNGHEKDIDNTLQPKGSVYTNTENAYNLLLPAEGEGITIEKNGYILQLKPQFGSLEHASVKENAIRYNHVADGIDLQYTANGNHVKEDIILNKPTAI